MSRNLATYFSKRIEGAYVGISHEGDTLNQFFDLVASFEPELILELGTWEGGVTLLMHDAFPSAEIHSYDVDFMTEYSFNRNQNPPTRTVDDEWFHNKCNFHLVDILNNGKGLESLKSLCKDKRKKILYCDNGHKPIEFQIYAPLLNSGDMVGVHDWNIEICLRDIQSFINDFNEYCQFGRRYISKFWIKK